MQNKHLSTLNSIICNRTVNSNLNTYMKKRAGVYLLFRFNQRWPFVTGILL